MDASPRNTRFPIAVAGDGIFAIIRGSVFSFYEQFTQPLGCLI